MDAVEDVWGKMTFDLAANADNAKAPDYYTEEQDSLSQSWDIPGSLWLNPPYSRIGLWAKKCAESQRRVFLLVPASTGSNWFRDYVWDYATVSFLAPRLTFDGHKDPYPKDLMLCVYGGRVEPARLWRWR